MTPEAFKQAWAKTGIPTAPVPLDHLKGLGLADSTVAFLNESGLPEEAAPLLNFAGGSADFENEISRLNERWDLGPEFARYISIGTDGEGNPIVLNTSKADQVEYLDHENQFEAVFMNSSIEALALFLLHYSDFIDLVTAENGADAYLDSNFSEAQLHTLLTNMIQTDKAATEKGFWWQELNNLQSEINNN